MTTTNTQRRSSGINSPRDSVPKPPSTIMPKNDEQATASASNRELIPENLKIYSISASLTSDSDEGQKTYDEKSKEGKLAIEAFISDIKKKFKEVEDVIVLDNKTLVVIDKEPILPAHVTLEVIHRADRPNSLTIYHRLQDRKGQISNVRWARVESIEPGAGREKNNAAAGAFLPEHGSLERIFGTVKCTELNYGNSAVGLVTAAEERDGTALTTVRALLAKKNKNHGRTIQSRDSFFTEKADETLHGVEIRFGTHQTVHLGGKNGVLVREKACHQLFFPAKSLASFMHTHFRTLATAPSTKNKDALTKFFQGLQVKIVGGPLHATKTIVNFSHLTPDLQMIPAGDDQITLATLYQQNGDTLKYPDLPAVNVGSNNRPFYVPAEVCCILPHQPFRNSISSSFQRELEVIKRSREQPKPSVVMTERDILDLGKDAQFHTPLGRSWENSSLDKAKILLVEVGKEVGNDKPGKEKKHFTNPAWKDLHQVVRKMSQLKVNASETDAQGPQIANVVEEILTLNFKPNTDCVSDWVKRLKEAMEKAAISPLQTVLVFAMQSNADRQEIWSQMKKARNSSDLGVQSIGVNLQTLRNKVSKERSAGLVRYSGQIFRKIFARTPIVSQTTEEHDISVGIHVTKLNVDEDEQSQFLVAMALRSASTNPTVYRTKVDFLGDGDDNNMSRMFVDLIHNAGASKTPPRKVILFRSGSLIPSKFVESGITNGEHLKQNDTHAADSKSDEKVNLEMAPLDKELTTFSDLMPITVPIYAFSVDDDELIDLSTAQDVIAKQVQQHRKNNDKHDQRASKMVSLAKRPQSEDTYSVYSHTAGTNSTAKATKLTLVTEQNVPERPPSKQESTVPSPTTPSNPSKKSWEGKSYSPTQRSADKLTSSGDRKRSSGLFNPPASEERRRSSSSFQGEGHLLAGPRQANAVKGSQGEDLHFMVEIGRKAMSELFYDDHICMHDGKWPIPTYLAKKAAGWATAHMEKEEGTKRFAIPEVHPLRKNILWYL